MLSTPPAFILSQDQTLMLKSLSQVQNLAWLIYPLFTVFGLLISQRPRMLDTCPLIDFSIFISLGIFKVVSLFNYQFSFCLFRNSLFIISHFVLFVKNFFSFLFFKTFHFAIAFHDNVIYLITSSFHCQQLFYFFFHSVFEQKKNGEGGI